MLVQRYERNIVVFEIIIHLKNDIPVGKAYTFEADVPVKIGDKISVGKAQAVVEVVNVPEEEVLGYKDKIKKVQKVEEE